MTLQCFREVRDDNTGAWSQCTRRARYMVDVGDKPQPVCHQHGLGYMQHLLGPLTSQSDSSDSPKVTK